MMDSSLAKQIRNNKYEKTDGSEIYLPGANVFIGGVFEHWITRNGEDLDHAIDKNMVVNEGLDHILDVAFSGGSQITTWYVGINKTAHTVVATDVASTYAGSGVADEVSTSEVDETVRQTWTEAGVSSQSITNSASPASYTASGALNVNGAFLISNNTLEGLTGTLAAASKFTSTRSLIATDVLNITYQLDIADA